MSAQKSIRLGSFWPSFSGFILCYAQNSPNTLDLTLKYPTHHLFHFCGGVSMDVVLRGGAVSITWKERNCHFPCFFIKFRKGLLSRRLKFQTVQTIPQKAANTLKNAALRIPYVFVWMYVWFLVGNVSHWLRIKLIPMPLHTHNSWGKGRKDHWVTITCRSRLGLKTHCKNPKHMKTDCMCLMVTKRW